MVRLVWAMDGLAVAGCEGRRGHRNDPVTVLGNTTWNGCIHPLYRSRVMPVLHCCFPDGCDVDHVVIIICL